MFKERIFDLKTRATLPIRLDIDNYKDYTGYEIRTKLGLFESYEREDYDLLRNAFLKYYYQVRIGHMDGIFIAYHNTAKIFGFKYMPKARMESLLFENKEFANNSFAISLKALDFILRNLVSEFNKTNLRITFHAKSSPNLVTIYVETLDEETIESDLNNKSESSMIDVDNVKEKLESLVSKKSVKKIGVFAQYEFEAEKTSEKSKHYWKRNFKFRRIEKSQYQYYNEYLALRQKQAEFYNKKYSSESQSKFVTKLKEISYKNLNRR